MSRAGVDIRRIGADPPGFFANAFDFVSAEAKGVQAPGYSPEAVRAELVTAWVAAWSRWGDLPSAARGPRSAPAPGVPRSAAAPPRRWHRATVGRRRSES